MTGLSVAGGKSLTRAEQARLVRLERTIDRAVEVVGRIAGEALATIRDERLYRLTHSSFEGYVLDRWGFSRSTAYRMIEAASPCAHIDPPEDESPGQPVSPRDSPATGDRSAGPPGDPGPEAATGDQAPVSGQLWAAVVAADVDELVLVLAPDLEADPAGYPTSGQRVLVSWG